MRKCISQLTPVPRNTINWTKTYLFLIGPLRPSLSEIWIKLRRNGFSLVVCQMVAISSKHLITTLSYDVIDRLRNFVWCLQYNYRNYFHIYPCCSPILIIILIITILCNKIWPMTYHKCYNHSVALLSQWWYGKAFRITTPLWREPPVTGGSLHKKPACRTLIIPLLLTGTSCWTNSRVAGDFRHHYTHVTAM